MYNMIIDNHVIKVVDFEVEKNLITLDIKLETESEMNEFLELYYTHDPECGLFEYEIDNQKYLGWCGRLLYDKNYNIRLYMAISNCDQYETRGYDVFRRNLLNALNEQKNALRNLSIALKDKGIIDDISFDSVIKHCPEKDYGDEMNKLVEDLSKYLTDIKETLADIRNGK